MKILITTMLCLICTTVSADSLYTGAWSTHINPIKEVNNETHNLVAYEHNNVVIGYFKNSFSDDTVVAMYQYHLLSYGDINMNIGVGATYGYYNCPFSHNKNTTQKVCVAVVPELVYTKYKVQPAILVFGNAIALSIKWEIN